MSRFTQKLSKTLRPFLKDSFLVAVSGGMDSMASLGLFLEMQRIFGVSVSVAHIHHGPSSDPMVADFRNRAVDHVHSFCAQRKTPFFLKTAMEPLKPNEASLREFRYESLFQIQKEQGLDWVVLGHHREDQLETRLIQMVRGTGPKGLAAMTLTQGPLIRPFLNWSLMELKEYGVQAGIKGLVDPSNGSGLDLRSWMRTRWLPDLERRRPGSVGALSQSLENLALVINSQSPSLRDYLNSSGALDLSKFWALSEEVKRQVLALFMSHHGLCSFGRGHLNEVMKRLDSQGNEHTFFMLGRQWSWNRQFLVVEKPSEIEPSNEQ